MGGANCGGRVLREVVPFTWIEHVASPLPRECSTTELKGHTNVAVSPTAGETAFFSVRPDHSAKCLFGQDFEQQRMLNSAINDVHGVDAGLGGIQG